MSDFERRELPLAAQLEGLLFVASEPVASTELAEALEISTKAVEAGLLELEALLAERGLRLQRHAGRVQLTTTPQLSSKLERFLGLEARSQLSRPALETLAIIAYNQPATRPQIDAIRGVNSETMLKSLLFKGLIHELGRSQGPGRPILYATTPDLLQHLGLNSIADLPPLQTPEPADSTDELLKG
ncbi:MAG: SMC-Scp complex subunit ScpB [Chloroflexota bacterium]